MKCQICHEIGHNDVACNKQRSFANVVNTPSNVVQDKICHKCKKPGHIKKNCPTNQYDVTHSSITLLNNDMESSFSTPNIVASDSMDDKLNSVQPDDENDIQGENQTDVPSVVLGDASQNNKRSNEQGGAPEGVNEGGPGGVHEGGQGGVHEGGQGDVHAGDQDGVHEGGQGGVHEGGQGDVHEGRQDDVHEGGEQGDSHEGGQGAVHGGDFESRAVQEKLPTGAQQDMDDDD